MWQISSHKNDISALGLQRVLGLGSYKTAWATLRLYIRSGEIFREIASAGIGI
jgi:hypothetical protein